MDNCDEDGLRFTDFNYHTQVLSDDDEDEPLGFECFGTRFGDDPGTQTMPPKTTTALEAETDMNESNQFKKGVPDLGPDFGNVEMNGRNFKDITFEDVKHIWFRTIDEAEKFYKYYSHVAGFSTRKAKKDRDKSMNVVYRRQWVCSKAGRHVAVEKTTPFLSDAIKQGPTGPKNKQSRNKLLRGTRLTRCGCPAQLMIMWSRNQSKYYVSKFVTQHNHDLVIAPEVHFLRSHRNVEEHDIAQVESLLQAQVSISRAYEFLVFQAGGYHNMRFTLKDLYNKLHQKNFGFGGEGDAEKVVSQMKAKGAGEKDFYFEYTVDKDARLANMFWRDHQSLLDYKAYGDVLIVDSTYKTNRYSKPMVLFVGANNHRATVVFGIALVRDEKEDTYDWVFSKFLESMQEIRPLSIISDGDEAMKNALERLMPQTRHRLCAWHIGRNIGQNLNSEEVMTAIGQLMFASLTVPDWELAWESVITKNGLQNNAWLSSLYNKRDRWAEAFFRGHFFGGMCSTQRCEGMNCQFKKQISRYTKLSDVMPRLGWKLCRLRDRVLRDNFNVKNSTPLFDTHMKDLEEQACKIFSHDIFIMIKSQIKFEGRFVVHQRFKFPNADSIVFYVGQYDRVQRRWCVEFRGNNGKPEWFCSCKMFESDGIPCAHLFCVMKYELVSQFPDCLIFKRWTRAVGETTLAPHISSIPNDKSAQCARYAALLIEAAQACLNYSITPESFNIGMTELQTFKSKSLQYQDACKTNRPPPTEEHTIVRDPLMSRTKGMSCNTDGRTHSEAKKNVITCGQCHQIGHNRRTCNRHQHRFTNYVSADGQGPSVDTPAVVAHEWEPLVPDFSAAVSDHISSPSTTALHENNLQATTTQPQPSISMPLNDCMWPAMEYPLLSPSSS